MRRAFTLLLATVSVMGLTAPAQAAVARPRLPSQQPHELVRGLFGDLPHAEVFLDEIAAGDEEGCGCDVVYPVEDLNGDERVEFVDAYLHRHNGEYVTDLDVREGRSGEPLWSSPLRLPGYAHTFPARVGSTGATGLLYYSYELKNTSALYIFELTVGAIDASGTELWQRRWQSTYGWAPGTGVLTGWFEDLLLIPGGSKQPSKLVLATSLFGDELPYLRLEEVDASSGETTEEWLRELADEPEYITLNLAPGLVTKDNDAILVGILLMARSNGTILAIDEVGQEPLWQIRLRNYWNLRGTADIHGDDRVELIVSEWRKGQTVLEARSAESGDLVWDRVASYATVMNNPGDKADLVVTDSPRHGRRAGTIRRIAPRGATLWQREVNLGSLKSQKYVDVFTHDAGDLGDDDISDVAVYLQYWVYPDDESFLVDNNQLLLDGVSGRVIAEGRDLFPLSGSLDGAGNDAARVEARSDRVVVSGVDGSSGRPTWTTEVGASPRSKWDPCRWLIDIAEAGVSDELFLVIPVLGADQEVLLDGETGKVLWHLDRD